MADIKKGAEDAQAKLVRQGGEAIIAAQVLAPGRDASVESLRRSLRGVATAALRDILADWDNIKPAERIKVVALLLQHGMVEPVGPRGIQARATVVHLPPLDE